MTLTIRHDWCTEEIQTLLELPLMELLWRAQTVHREANPGYRVQLASLLSVKTGGCEEDCAYCSQSIFNSSDLAAFEAQMQVEPVLKRARVAKEAGADRFCMGAAWRDVKDGPEFDRVCEMVSGVKELGLETCVTLGMLNESQANKLKDAGLDYYNHNLDTGRSHYEEVTSTRTYDERLQTLENVRGAGLSVCCGGILGLGEERKARAELLAELANLEPQPESVPINELVPVEGTPMESNEKVDWTELVRVIAAARILMPKAYVRLSAGRTEMTEEGQAMCFLAGANSIFVGESLLTTPNPTPGSDAALFAKLDIQPLISE